MKILIVDDNQAVRDGICEYLERFEPGCVCEIARDGHEALDVARKIKPDVVVLDMVMPAMNGLETARLISSAIPGTRIVLHTAHDSEILSINAHRYGVWRVVAKADGKNLLAALRDTISSMPIRKAS